MKIYGSIALIILNFGNILSLTTPPVECDVAIIGAGIGGLSAGAILSSRYNMKVHVYESHYRVGGCAHSFPIKSKEGTTYLFDAGPTILLGCSSVPYNPLRQVLNHVGASSNINWIRYDSWGMHDETGDWVFKLGENYFEEGPLLKFGGREAVEEFRNLRKACAPLCAGSAAIPTMALRGDKLNLLPLLGYLDALKKVIPYGDVLNGNFKDLMEGNVKNQWLRNWIDALAFSLSGLPAAETGAAALAYTLFDLHRPGAALDYPRGGMGSIAEVLSDVIKSNGGEVRLSTPVVQIGIEGKKARGVKLKNGSYVRAKRAVLCNSNIWSVDSLLDPSNEQLTSAQRDFFRAGKEKAATKSFMHLHLGLDSSGLDLSRTQAHYTVMDRGLSDPCADRNMVAVSNPSRIDPTLTDRDDRIIVHAYGAGCESYEPWRKYETSEAKSYDSLEYQQAKLEGSAYLYRSVSKALGISIDEVKSRSEVALIGSPLTHKRYLNRFEGTYGPTFRDTLQGPLTPIEGLYLTGDSTFPGIGVPAVAVSGANAANTIVNVVEHVVNLIKN